MGHVRLGRLPRSKAWKDVVGLITAGADASQIANATIRAADKAFSFVLNDRGFTEAVWLMTQLAIAARSGSRDFRSFGPEARIGWSTVRSR